MGDLGQVGGLEPLHDRFGAPLPPHHDRVGPGPDASEAAPAATDSAWLSAATEVAYPLLRQRVLAATERVLPAGVRPRPETFWRGGAPATPQVAVAWIRGEQRWLGDGLDPASVPAVRAFVSGLRETRAILHEVAPDAAAAQAWLRAVRACLRRPRG